MGTEKHLIIGCWFITLFICKFAFLQGVAGTWEKEQWREWWKFFEWYHNVLNTYMAKQPSPMLCRCNWRSGKKCHESCHEEQDSQYWYLGRSQPGIYVCCHCLFLYTFCKVILSDTTYLTDCGSPQRTRACTKTVMLLPYRTHNPEMRTNTKSNHLINAAQDVWEGQVYVSLLT